MKYPRAYVYFDLDNKSESMSHLSKLVGSKTPILLQEEFDLYDDHVADSTIFRELDKELSLKSSNKRYSLCINSPKLSDFFIANTASKNVSIYWVDDEGHRYDLHSAFNLWEKLLNIENSLFNLSTAVEDALDFGSNYIPEFLNFAEGCRDAALECKAKSCCFTPLKQLAEHHFKKTCHYGISDRYDL